MRARYGLSRVLIPQKRNEKKKYYGDKMSDIVLVACISGIIGISGTALGGWLNFRLSRYQSEEEQKRDRIAFLTEVLRLLSDHYGEARRFLYLEDDGKANESQVIADFARTLGAFTGLARSVDDPDINAQIPVIWKRRENNSDRGDVQQALENIISRIGNLIKEMSDEKSKR